MDKIGENEKLLRASKDFQKLGEGKKRRRLLREAQRKDGTYVAPKSSKEYERITEEERIREEEISKRLIELEKSPQFERPEGMSDEEYTRELIRIQAETDGIKKGEKLNNKEFCAAFSKKALSSIFKAHKVYDNAMFSDYDLIGISNQNRNFKKQKPIFFLRSSLDGKLTKFQKIIAKIFGAHLVAYEHRHPNKHSKGMLLRNQTWYRFIKIIV